MDAMTLEEEESFMEDFGKAVRKPVSTKCEARPQTDACEPKDPLERCSLQQTQWTLCGGNTYTGVSQTLTHLYPGVYTSHEDCHGKIIFIKKEVRVDAWLNFPDSLYDTILNEIDDFWKRRDKFEEYGFLHRRGYLLYGPAGSGKTILVQQIMDRIIKGGDIVLLSSNSPRILSKSLYEFREIEPDRKVVCVLEDIDAIVVAYGEDELLSLLDGEKQIGGCLNIATTNYPERLDKRLVARPRRFDRVIKIDMPSDAVREMYLREKLKINGNDISKWIEETAGLSFAALAELVISVKCLGNSFEDTLKILRKMQDNKASSAEFESASLGFKSSEK